MSHSRGFGVFVVAAFAVAVVVRLVPHPPNFTPMGALALFAGAYVGQRALAFALPLVAMLASDVLLQAMGGPGFHASMAFVYVGFLCIVGIGFLVRSKRQRILPVVGASVAASTVFFIVSNLGVWFTGLYERSLAGLVTCFTVALPFYSHQGTELAGALYLGDLLCTGIIFGLAALVLAPAPSAAVGSRSSATELAQ